ncbi:MAG: (2Fe-2S)-binding protein [Rudaea sp.]
MARELVINVNGKPHVVEATPDTPLLYVLRNELGLNSPQFGCGLEQCGSCNVLLGSRAAATCKLPVSEATGISITTLEGLGTSEQLHPIQQAFIDEQAAQCGYCISGMMITTAALLHDHPQPTDAQIREALNGNLCRCGAHPRIVRAVKRAAARLAALEV